MATCAALSSVAVLGGAGAGLVEGLALVRNDVGGGGGPEAGGLLVFIPVVILIRAVGGLVVGAGLGLALGVLPALAIAALDQRISSGVRWLLRATFGALALTPLLLLVVKPQTLEPTLLAMGILRELPRRPVDETKPTRPVAVQVTALARAMVPSYVRGDVTLRPPLPGSRKAREVVLTTTGANAVHIHPGQQLEITGSSIGGFVTVVIVAVQTQADGTTEAIGRSDEEVLRPPGQKLAGRVALSPRETWVAPAAANVVFAGDDDLHLLEVRPDRPGHGHVAHRRMAWGERTADNRRELISLDGEFSAHLIFVTAPTSSFRGGDLGEGSEVTY